MHTLLEEMRASLGVQETEGPDSNPEIAAYFADCGWELSELGEDSTVAWCAARLGSALTRCGYPIPPKDVNLTARSYCTYGAACDPEPGAIAVIPRGKSSWQGHVFVIEAVLPDGRWRTIGGNQGTLGAVTRATVDPRRTQVLAVRKPVAPQEPPKPQPVKEAVKRSRTLLGLLAAFGATLGAWFQDAVAVVLDAAGQLETLAPARKVGEALGLSAPRVLFGMAIAGLALALYAKLDDTARGRVVKP